LNNLQSYDKLNVDQPAQLRRLLMCISNTAEKAAKLPDVNSDDKRFLNKLKGDLLNTVEYAPIWIIVAVALALSLGTMVGWRRVANTIGEKIGKKGMTYAQGMSAQMTAAVSIGVASYTGMPVSTTHVLSSSVAGTMLVDGGGVQSRTIKNILLAWVLTLPVSIVLSGGLYWIALKFVA
jgi:low-affinity inorganic phosphate transporter